MPSITAQTVSAGIGVYIVLVLLWGYFVSQQLLLAVSLGVLGALLAGLGYVAWQYFGGSGGTTGDPL